MDRELLKGEDGEWSDIAGESKEFVVSRKK
jgi:hypothetical protein